MQICSRTLADILFLMSPEEEALETVELKASGFIRGLQIIFPQIWRSLCGSQLRTWMKPVTGLKSCSQCSKYVRLYNIKKSSWSKKVTLSLFSQVKQDLLFVASVNSHVLYESVCSCAHCSKTLPKLIIRVLAGVPLTPLCLPAEFPPVLQFLFICWPGHSCFGTSPLNTLHRSLQCTCFDPFALFSAI